MKSGLVRHVLSSVFLAFMGTLVFIYTGIESAKQNAEAVNFVTVKLKNQQRELQLPLQETKNFSYNEVDDIRIRLPIQALEKRIYVFIPNVPKSFSLDDSLKKHIHNLRKHTNEGLFRRNSLSFELTEIDQLEEVEILFEKTEQAIDSFRANEFLSKVYYSTTPSISRITGYQSFFEQTIRPILVGIQLILALNMALVGTLISDKVLLWLSLFFASATVLTNGYILLLLGISPETFKYFFLIFASVPAIALVGIPGEITQRVSRKTLALVMLIIILLNVFISHFTKLDARYHYILIHMPIALFGLYYFTRFLIKTNFDEYKLEKKILLGSLLFLFLGWLHDLLVHFGRIEAEIFLTQFSRMALAFVAFGYTILLQEKNHIMAVTKISQQTDTIKENESKIFQQNLRNMRAKEELKRFKERQDLNRELHDGISSNLVSIVSLLQKQKGNEHVATLAKLTIRELRSVIAASNIRDADIGLVVSLFRENYLQYFDISSQKVVFNMEDRTLSQKIQSSHSIHLIRIFQEAFTNIIKHAPGAEVEVRIFQDENSWVTVSISNTLPKTNDDLSSSSSNLGMKNIGFRAKKLGGEIAYNRCQNNFTLKVVFPLLDSTMF